MCSTPNWNVFLGILLTLIGPLKVAVSTTVKTEPSHAVVTTSLTLQSLWLVKLTFWCWAHYLNNIIGILQDICRRLEDCKQSDDKPLTIISYVGMSVSIICLMITIISLSLFK